MDPTTSSSHTQAKEVCSLNHSLLISAHDSCSTEQAVPCGESAQEEDHVLVALLDERPH